VPVLVLYTFGSRIHTTVILFFFVLLIILNETRTKEGRREDNNNGKAGIEHLRSAMRGALQKDAFFMNELCTRQMISLALVPVP